MISPQAIIDPSAKLGENVTVSPFSIIGPNVEIGAGTWIGPHVVVNGPTKIGKDNKIFQFASIGEDPQDKKYAGEPTELIVGDRNVFRECTTISRGTATGEGKTIIGSDNLLMAYVHIAHDCVLGNHITFSNNASLAGHVFVDDYSSLGGFVGVHQFAKIGRYSFCGGASVVISDVLPYITVSGHPAQSYGLNVVGLKRHGFTPEDIAHIKRAYKVLCREGSPLSDSIQKLEAMVPECKHLQIMLDFVKESKRGYIR